MSGIRKGIPLKERLLAKRKVLRNGCWKWIGLNTIAQKKLNPNNLIYGVMRFQGRSQGVHRLSWIAHNGPIPDGKKVLHKCDFPLCFNPKHLFLGTQLINMRDCANKNRIARGTRQSRAKLTDKSVRGMRKFYQPWKRGRGIFSTARKFGISRRLATAVIRRERWRHVK